MARRRLWTVGHSTRSVEELADLLSGYGVEQVIDVRRFPRGKRQPHLSRENLEAALPATGIAYVWMGEELGGFRKGGYEAFMASDEFRSGIRRLEEIASQRPSAVMCAEVVWFRCHRRYIARAMFDKGWRVTHVVNAGKTYEED